MSVYKGWGGEGGMIALRGDVRTNLNGRSVTMKKIREKEENSDKEIEQDEEGRKEQYDKTKYEI